MTYDDRFGRRMLVVVPLAVLAIVAVLRWTGVLPWYATALFVAATLFIAYRTAASHPSRVELIPDRLEWRSWRRSGTIALADVLAVERHERGGRVRVRTAAGSLVLSGRRAALDPLVAELCRRTGRELTVATWQGAGDTGYRPAA